MESGLRQSDDCRASCQGQHKDFAKNMSAPSIRGTLRLPYPVETEIQVIETWRIIDVSSEELWR